MRKLAKSLLCDSYNNNLVRGYTHSYRIFFPEEVKDDHELITFTYTHPTSGKRFTPKEAREYLKSG